MPVSCHPHSAVEGLTCYQVDVPLDRAGVVPGTVSLHVEVVPASGTPRGTVFLIAGGPGQGSAGTFGLSAVGAVATYRELFPGYSLVAYDDRGTGSSGLLECPSLQASATASADDQARLVGTCAASLGAARDFYGTGDHAEDLEAVRGALGLGKIVLYGVSYGTKLALAYALAHPDDVDRLVLDSIEPLDEPDAFGASALARLPGTMRRYCAGGSCRGVTSDFAGEVVALAKQLAAKPLRGTIPQPEGGSRTWTLGGVDFLELVIDMDTNPGLAAEMPADVHAALAGNARPLLRAVALEALSYGDAEDLSLALYAATNCHDGPFPWPAATPVADRPALYSAAVAALPAGTLGPFGRWAAQFGNAEFCLGWPSPAGGLSIGTGALPDVPVLAFSGGLDLRTPTADAAAVVGRFPQGHLVVVPGTGHSVLGTDLTGCSGRIVRRWLLTGAVGSCPRGKPLLTPTPAFPKPGPTPPGRPATAEASLALARTTLADAEAVMVLSIVATGAPVVVAGSYGGTLTASSFSGFSLSHYSIDPGVEVTGKVNLRRFGPPAVFDGRVRLSGAGVAGGTLVLDGDRLHGTLAGRPVGR